MNQRKVENEFKIRSAEFVISAVEPYQFPDSDRPEIAFVGRSNVGKSSLLNKILNRKKLARTSSTPGRTQLINFFNINDDIYFVDLPGYGYAKAPMEVRAAWRPMIEGYLQGDRDIRLVLVLVDIRRDPQEEEQLLLEWLDMIGLPYLIIITKADKLKKSRKAARVSAIRKGYGLTRNPLVFSALTGEGKEDIWREIVESCDFDGGEIEE